MAILGLFCQTCNIEEVLGFRHGHEVTSELRLPVSCYAKSSVFGYKEMRLQFLTLIAEFCLATGISHCCGRERVLGGLVASCVTIRSLFRVGVLLISHYCIETDGLAVVCTGGWDWRTEASFIKIRHAAAKRIQQQNIYTYTVQTERYRDPIRFHQNDVIIRSHMLGSFTWTVM